MRDSDLRSVLRGLLALHGSAHEVLLVVLEALVPEGPLADASRLFALQRAETEIRKRSRQPAAVAPAVDGDEVVLRGVEVAGYEAMILSSDGFRVSNGNLEPVYARPDGTLTLDPRGSSSVLVGRALRPQNGLLSGRWDVVTRRVSNEGSAT